MARRRQWHADWWLTCFRCNRQDWIDGFRYRDRVKTIRAIGWKYTVDSGWVCSDCKEVQDD